MNSNFEVKSVSGRVLLTAPLDVLSSILKLEEPAQKRIQSENARVGFCKLFFTRPTCILGLTELTVWRVEV